MQMRDPRAGGDTAGLFALLYVSEMAAPDAIEVAQICERSRDNNRRDGITGLLVFDGKAFCQFVEGPEAPLAALRERLERDPRHLNMHVLQFGSATGGRRFPSWRLGYAFTADPAAIQGVETSRAGGAADAHGGWLESLGALAPQDR